MRSAAREAEEIAEAFERLGDELRAGPKIPSEREVVLGYARGEIGDRAAMMVLDLDHPGLITACSNHGVPPLFGALAPEDER